MLDGEVHYRPNYWFAVTQQDDKWMAFGSRKVSQITVENHNDYFSSALDTWNWNSYLPASNTIKFHGTSHTLGYVVASSPLAAIGALLDSFRADELEELEEKHLRELTLANFKKKRKKNKREQ